MRMLILATASIMVFGMGAAVTQAADTSNSASKVGDKPAVSGTSQSPQPRVNAPNTPSSLPSNANRPTGSMADPPLASSPSDLGSGHAPDK